MTVELFEWRVVVDDVVVELLAELRVDGDTAFLDDVAIYPASAGPAVVGAAALLRIARVELPALFRSTGATWVVLRGTRLSGANPGRRVEVRFPIVEEVADGDV